MKTSRRSFLGGLLTLALPVRYPPQDGLEWLRAPDVWTYRKRDMAVLYCDAPGYNCTLTL